MDACTQATATRTAYAIRLTDSGLWLGDARHGVSWRKDSAEVVRFDSMTRATIAAIYSLGLAPEAFSVEAV